MRVTAHLQGSNLCIIFSRATTFISSLLFGLITTVLEINGNWQNYSCPVSEPEIFRSYPGEWARIGFIIIFRMTENRYVYNIYCRKKIPLHIFHIKYNPTTRTMRLRLWTWLAAPLPGSTSCGWAGSSGSSPPQRNQPTHLKV